MKVTKLLFHISGLKNIAKNVKNIKGNEFKLGIKSYSLNFQQKYQFASIQKQ